MPLHHPSSGFSIRAELPLPLTSRSSWATIKRCSFPAKQLSVSMTHSLWGFRPSTTSCRRKGTPTISEIWFLAATSMRITESWPSISPNCGIRTTRWGSSGDSRQNALLPWKPMRLKRRIFSNSTRSSLRQIKNPSGVLISFLLKFH